MKQQRLSFYGIAKDRACNGMPLALCLSLLCVLSLAALAPVDYFGVLLTLIICSAVGMLAFILVQDATERRVLSTIFVVALGVRLVFTIIFYESGLSGVLGGADDTGWLIWWKLSRLWQGWPGNFWFGATATERAGIDFNSFPTTLEGIYSSNYALNRGTSYFSTWFYYLLDIRSQPALAVLNGFLNALTVVLLYRLTRAFYSVRSALFVAGIAVILPSFLLWSALTVKESWVILCEVALFYAVWQVSRNQSSINRLSYGIWCVFLLAILWGLRFYAAGISAAMAILVWLWLSARQPLRAVGLTVGLLFFCGVSWCFVLSSPENVAHETEAQLKAAMLFRKAISTGDARWATNSGVPLDYDLLTAEGLTQQLVVGTGYVLLSPFPWQTLSGRQLFVLPEVLLWWLLCFGFVLPGLFFMARWQPRLCLSLVTFMMPFVLLYAVSFGNIGLAHRQRSQIAPFLLIFAGAGYERLITRRRSGGRAGATPGVAAEQTAGYVSTDENPGWSTGTTTAARIIESQVTDDQGIACPMQPCFVSG